MVSLPAQRPNAWVSEVLAPRCQLTETSSTCLQRMKDVYDVVILGWAPLDAAGPPIAPAAPARPPLAPAAAAGAPVAPRAPTGASMAPAAPAGPPAAPEAPSGPPLAPPYPTVAVPLSDPPVALTRPPAAPTGLLKRPHSPGGFPGASPGCFEKECPHTVTGSQDFYPVKRVVKYKVVKGQMMKQVE
ncbi:translation initiation factor IF-2-like isoform X1 [Acanthopagrus latus]|uniref:translation initiation factor IF-2-like isoform X1 n=2 Tax=Acanthopagrus latus TaxID=8177 RepID=UPI00187CA1F2|nr:translation initiation factor IF-2-like isoform X1 [Acanthopagrus latus]XP_036947929.1 translation initiation factor IF-2-like isoform X1 [Acanthopagrus latus]XP_036947945.1 translation initiation factor IF-2-like isoform X1 [Acanthopagrus latus]